MGLDSVELVIRFEDEFGLNISDADAYRMRTPRDVIDYVMTRVEQSRSLCLSQQVFHRLRQSWCAHLNVRRAAIRPQTKLDNSIPKRNRQTIWAGLREDASWHDFDLRRPKWMRISLSLMPLIVLIWLTMQSRFSVGLLCASTLAFGAYILTLPFKTSFPDDKECVADVVRFSLLNNPKGMTGERRTWSRDEVAETVRRITLDETGLSSRKYHEDARFVEDLGID